MGKQRPVDALPAAQLAHALDRDKVYLLSRLDAVGGRGPGHDSDRRPGRVGSACPPARVVYRFCPTHLS